MQFVKLELPADEMEFDGQTMHIAGPVNDLYVPATHTAHAPPSGPEEPALQMQLVKLELPAGELEFVGQSVHGTIQEATNPGLNTLASDVNTTCMYPVLDV